MNGRKLSAAALATVIGASVLAGCSTKAPEPAQQPAAPTTEAPKPAEKVTLEFWAHWASEQRRPTVDKIMKKWNDANPNIQVNYTPVPFDQIQTKVAAGVAAGNAPDIVVLDTFTTQFRAYKKQSTDLSALGADALKAQYFDAPWSANVYEGKVYGLPFVTDTRMMFYNKTLFKEVGLDPEKAPVSWDDLWAFSEKIDKINGGKIERVGFHPLAGGGGIDLWGLNGYGGNWDAKGNPTFNSAKNLEAMNWIKKWNDRYGAKEWTAFAAAFQGGANHPFITGQIAMAVDVATFSTQITKYAPNMEWGMIPIPTPDGKQHPRSAFSGGFNVELPAKTKHPKEAFEFAKYFTSEAAAVWAQEQNDMPAFRTAGNSVTNPYFKLALANMANTTFDMRNLFAQDVGSINNKMRDDLLAGVDPKAILDEAQKSVETMIKENSGK